MCGEQTRQVTTGLVVFLILLLSGLQILQVKSLPLVTPSTAVVDDEVTHVSLDHLPKGDEVLDRNRRAECPVSPDGQGCIPCPDDPIASNLQYEFTDDNGVTCTCELCPAPFYMDGPCICPSTGGMGDVSCIPATPGKTFMTNYRNRCRVPFNCTQCPGNMVEIQACTFNQDRQCGCSEGYYQSGDTTCELARCPNNHHAELDQKPDEIHTSYTCVPCPEGFIQPNDNSSDKCYKIPPAVTEPNQEDLTGVSDEGVSTDKIDVTEEPTDLYSKCTRLLPRPIVIGICFLAMLVTFVIGCVWQNKCAKCLKESGQVSRDRNNPGSTQYSGADTNDSGVSEDLL